YVASKQNPADLISRGTNPSTLSQSIWTKGPEFLSVPDLPNPSVQIVFEIDNKDTEVKVKSMVTEVSVESTTQHFIDKIIQRYNSWYKIKRIVARLIQVKHRLLCKTKVCDITTEILKEAEVIIIRHIQKTSFAEELYSLKTVGVVKKTSDIRNLSPRVNEEGLIVVGGRVEMTEENINKHPYIISHKHPISYILAREFHERAHVGTEWTLSLLRQQFWVTKARIAIKKILKDCLVCKKLFGKPLVQQMSSLPKERLEAFKAPFTNVGIDCFGPFFVKCGRATVKRYGCIFTCFSIRAVHLEKLNSLETDSFISSLRRFIARRGNLSQLWSDNGTNFVGAEAELARDVQDFLLRRNVSWHFNPPHASHMGGVWERQIRTVRKVLQGLLDKYSGELTDEILETLFCEVESMVNSRPITKLTDDTNDKTAITPNQLISVANGPVYYPSDYKKSDMLRKRWRFVQYLANQFWRKWVKMYLPELQKRQKWLKEQRNLEEGDLVLLVEEVTPRYLWPMGIVEEVKLGRDGLVRVVKVKTNTTTLIRPISKVVALEFLNASNIQQKGEC
ncbi:MAG: transposase family protein, partial [Gammaproteobacteria bacterium]|nr:transposase family protein [Gammaproteobacteria bacterium]